MEDQRAPLLSNEDCSNRKGFWPVPWNDERDIGARNARNWYEAKITSGELIVSYWPPIKQGPPVWSCLKCGWYDTTVDYNTPQSHCPRCK